MPSPVSPLDIFEIVAKVGSFVRVWKYDKYWSWKPFKFIPREILSHALVSKTWHAALLPICWEFYDGDAMSHIPNEVVSKYSHHFMYVVNCQHLGPFHCTALRLLETENNNANLYKMIKEMQLSISRLKFVTTTYSDTRERLDLSDDDRGELLKLSMLDTTISNLELRNWIIDDIPKLLEFLTRYNRLSSISLKYIVDFDEFPYSISSMENTPLPQPYLILPTITTLRLDGSLQASSALLDMATCCPNLTRLEVVGSWMSDDEAYTSTPIYLYCPNLSSFAIKIPEIDTGCGRFMANDDDLARLIANLIGPPGTGKLHTFEAQLVEFGKASAQALVKHAKDTLESFNLNLRESYSSILQKRPFDGVRYVRTICSKLTQFSVDYDGDNQDSENLDEPLEFLRPDTPQSEFDHDY